MIKVFILEDNAIIAEQIRLMVDDFDHFDVTEVAYNFNSAEKFLANNSVDVALLDINLEEEKSGFDVAEKLIEKNIPFLFLTSYSDQTTLNKAIKYNPIGYIVKPITEENLFANLELMRIKHLNKK